MKRQLLPLLLVLAVGIINVKAQTGCNRGIQALDGSNTFYKYATVYDYDGCYFGSNTVYEGDIAHPVDGHYKVRYDCSGVGTVVESTGNYETRYPVGTVYTETFGSSGNPAYKSLATSSICGNPTGSLVYVELTDTNNCLLGTDYQTACGSYTWIDNKTYVASDSTSTFIIAGEENECDSIVTLHLTILPLPQPVVGRSGDTLSTESFSSYQWLLNNQPIEGAIFQNHLAAESGLYSVVVTNANDCSDTSVAVNVVVRENTGIEPAFDTVVRIYPNPAGESVTIGNLPPGSYITLTDLRGKKVYALKSNNTNEILSTTSLVNGVYIIQVENNGAISNRKLFVNN